MDWRLRDLVSRGSLFPKDSGKMIKINACLKIAAALYLLIAIVAFAQQTIDRRITVVEQQILNNTAQINSTADRLNNLESHVYANDVEREGRLAALERSMVNFGQILLAVAAGVLVQLVTTAIGGLRAARSRKDP